MYRLIIHSSTLLLLTLLPLAGHAAPPPYWPGYPPPPYYYPPLPTPLPIKEATPSLPSVTAPPVNPPETSIIDGVVAEPSVAEQAEKESVKVETAVVPQPDPVEKVEVPAEGAIHDDNTRLVQEIASAIQQGNFAEAYYLWRPRAESGDANAQYGIGWMYHNGYGLAISDDEAIAWWELASHQGHIDATFALGMLYGLGEGAVRRDMTLAVSYYHRAAREGHEDARLLLRTLMAEGDSNAIQLMQTLLNEGRQREITTPATVLSTRANVRKGHGTQFKVITSLQQGHQLLPLKRNGRWLQVGIMGKEYTGWIHDSLIDKDILPDP
jgi:hypothetical protein